MQNKKKIIKIIGAVLLVALVAFIAYFVYLQTLVARGELIKDNGQWFKRADWERLFGEYDTPAKNTPEEVYKQFRQALLDNDTETALGLIREESREYYQTAFEDQERLKVYKKIPALDLIRKNENNSYSNYSSYSYFMIGGNSEIPYFIDFIKNRDGYWEIDSI